MSSVSVCQDKIRRYQILKTNIISISNDLSSANSNINYLKQEINSKYSVDDVATPIVTKTTVLKENINSTIHMLNDQVVTAIDNEISNLNGEIEKIQREEQERHEREEQERREREEQERREREEQKRREREEQERRERQEQNRRRKKYSSSNKRNRW